MVPDFVVQGGNSEEERPQQLRFLIGQHTLPAEFQDDKIHVRGALAMSRSYSENPDKRSSGTTSTSSQAEPSAPKNSAESNKTKADATPRRRPVPTPPRRAPHLDGEHTVFGRVVEGMDVVDRLAATPRDGSDWPVERLEVRMNVLSEAPALDSQDAFGPGSAL